MFSQNRVNRCAQMRLEQVLIIRWLVMLNSDGSVQERAFGPTRMQSRSPEAHSDFGKLKQAFSDDLGRSVQANVFKNVCVKTLQM